ncbi:hypothetical protein BBP40_010764 [Aspergillus hancockii]|nr:hypothetical protein BBP40_010764 [Aspergillus hancockii]
MFHRSQPISSPVHAPVSLQTRLMIRKSNWPSEHRHFFGASAIYDGETNVIHVPSMAESISEGVLSTFNKQVGDYVEYDEEAASIEISKIDIAVNASHGGTITKLLVNEGDTVTFGQAIIEISLE